jgi:alpha-N-arabinofuranosidase
MKPAALALFCAAAASAARGAQAQGLPRVQRLSARPVVCRVDTTKILREIPRALYGTNLEWFQRADGIAGADGEAGPSWSALARDEGIAAIRFPGGTLSDFYHWRDGIGPASRRPTTEHPTDRGRSPNVFGTPEFLRFCRAAGASPLITVNAGTGDAAEAAGWVAYCNRPGDPERAADGLPAPARVELWEVGNELYLPGNPSDKKIITISPDDYAARFLEFAAAMRKVDPAIKLIAIGTANSYAVKLPYPDWTEILLKKAAPQIDYVAVHDAYYPNVLLPEGAGAKEVFQSLWAAPEAVDRSLRALDALISKYEGGRRIGIAVTEWGALFPLEPRWIDHVKTMGASVYLGRLMQVFLREPRVAAADYFKFTDRDFMGWVGYDGRPKVPYYVLQLFARHFGSRLVDAAVDGPTYDVAALGAAHAESRVPELTAVAALDDSGRKLFVNVVNRSWSTIHQLRFDTGAFAARDAATVWALSSPGLTDHNGRDMPEEIPRRYYVEPALHPAAKPVIRIERRTVRLGAPLMIPPYSILTVEIDARS